MAPLAAAAAPEGGSDGTGEVLDVQAIAAGAGDSAAGGAAAAVDAAAQLGYWPSHMVMQGIDLIHTTSGMPFWMTIMAVTISLRVAMLPVLLSTIKNARRMTQLKPELEIISERIKADPKSNDPQRQQMYSKQLQALFQKYDAHPIRSFYGIGIQLPVFMSFFFGLKSMGDFYPEIQQGGTLWFTDLAAADPTFIFPVVTTASFIFMIELGADGMDANQQATMKNVMRGLGLLMLPFTYQMPCAVFCYWSAANFMSVCQTLALKVPSVRDYFGVPPPPQPPKTTAEPLQPIDPMSSPVKAILAQARGEALNKQAIAAKDGKLVGMDQTGTDGSSAPGARAFDEKKHVALNVSSHKPKKTPSK
eukprot:CAMPEP_0118970136 /NCGR_PEP_ID=MMETSP1173-20130426/7097_1 /TAXON_ID=1034831 /ORGANISM="Rhizochromulina marina cf, Strain CCMP1243" /LENGTH=361 /DNA_ID=CAMNT_0006919455 /DNA_START=15 /DNA_END=1100 /DNA_ORIENTATION=+